MADQKRWMQQLESERNLKAECDALAARLVLAEAALTRAGYTQLSNTNDWKPPVGPSVAPYLDEIDRLSAELLQEREKAGAKARPRIVSCSKASSISIYFPEADVSNPSVRLTDLQINCDSSPDFTFVVAIEAIANLLQDFADKKRNDFRAMDGKPISYPSNSEGGQ